MNTLLRNLAGAVIGGAALTIGGLAVAAASPTNIGIPLPCFDDFGDQVPCPPADDDDPPVFTIPPGVLDWCLDDAGQLILCPPDDGDGDADADADGDGADADGADGDADADGGDGDADGGDGDGGDGDGGDGDADADGGDPGENNPDPCGLDEVCAGTPTFTG